MTPAVTVGLLGPIMVWVDGRPRSIPGRMERLLLAHLAVAGGRAVSVDALVDALWAADPPPTARNALQVKVSRLRALLVPHAGALRETQGSYLLDADLVDTDALQVAAALYAGELRLQAGDGPGAAELLSGALRRWRGEPLAGLGEHPRLVAARARFAEARTSAREAHAEAAVADPASRDGALATVRAILQREPLRQRARLTLMRGLDAAGRRGEALAVYDAGRRLYVQTAGLEPPEELQSLFAVLLEKERAAVRRGRSAQRASPVVRDGLLVTARWLADEGDVGAALDLAVRGAWWWWMYGPRGRARDLLQDLLDGSEGVAGDGARGRARLDAEVWHAVFRTRGPHEATALDRGTALLTGTGRPAWSDRDALAAALVAERLYERGRHPEAAQLRLLAREHYVRTDDTWGLALCGLVGARGRLLAGHLADARRGAEQHLATFAEIGDAAGQLLALDVLGYVAEVAGDLPTAAARHERALALARAVEAPHWAATQLVRCGNVQTLAGAPGAQDQLEQAVRLSIEIDAPAVTALARNGLGVALLLAGDAAAADRAHRAAHRWYARTASESGLAYTEARLAMVGADGASGTAADRAVRSLTLAVRTRDPRAVAHSLEAVALATPDAPTATRALAAASRLRADTGAPLPAGQAAPLRRRRAALRGQLGVRFAECWQQGRHQPAAVTTLLRELDRPQ